MRVTQRVEEYIRSKVRDVYTSEEEKKYEGFQSQVSAFENYVDEQFYVYIDSMNNAASEMFGLPEQVHVKERHWGISVSISDCKEYMEHSNNLSKLRTLADEKTRDIIIELELGGTKGDLDNILSGLVVPKID